MYNTLTWRVQSLICIKQAGNAIYSWLLFSIYNCLVVLDLCQNGNYKQKYFLLINSAVIETNLLKFTECFGLCVLSFGFVYGSGMQGTEQFPKNYTSVCLNLMPLLSLTNK